MGVALPDAAISAVDEELRPLIPGDMAGRLDSFPLRCVDGVRPTAPRSADCPAFVVRDYVLIALTHRNLLQINDLTRPQPAKTSVDSARVGSLQYQYRMMNCKPQAEKEPHVWRTSQTRS